MAAAVGYLWRLLMNPEIKICIYIYTCDIDRHYIKIYKNGGNYDIFGAYK